MPSAGLIFGQDIHHLDHLAPLCALKGIPLILTDEKMCELAEKFYLDLHVLYYEEYEAPNRLVNRFDTIYYSTPRVLFEQVFYFAQAMHNKRVRTIWCPHGNSDKGRHSPFMEALAEEETLLTYGPRMEAFLAEKGIKGETHRIGNYRLAYYEKHKSYYETLLPPKEKPALLYAPTWKDSEDNSSFEKLYPYLKNCPEGFELIIKLHPNLYHQFPKEVKELSTLDDFPPLYPLLERADLLITDLSSVAYDYLYFEKPLLLLKDSPLCQAGRFLPEEEYSELFSVSESLIGTNPPPNLLYQETFSPYSLTLRL